MNVLILGADGYLGWPTAMNLAELGHNVFAVDNYLRRNMARDRDVETLYSLPNLVERCRIWEETGGKSISPMIGDLRDWTFVQEVFQVTSPDIVIHYAEQPSAPYSMMDRPAAMLTITNNLEVTANTIFALREFCPDAHLIKLGTMGEYGTPDIDIEEGWLTVHHNGRSDRFLYPRQAGSLYHTTKIMDTDLLWYYVRMWDLRVTDLMQGPVYGIFTDESRRDERLLPHFAYDELFGTVVNRFVTQAVVGYPLTVYGKGEQTRGYLDIRDTLQCVRLSLENPAEKGELRIFNQFVETFSVNQLAERVQQAGKQIGLGVRIESLENPRKEKEEHYYNPKHSGLLELGLTPHYMDTQMLVEMLEKVQKHSDAIDLHKIFRNTKWA